jgi:hypothetical protein
MTTTCQECGVGWTPGADEGGPRACPECGTEAQPLDPLVEMEKDGCGSCGAFMVNPELHAEFHARQKRQFEDLHRMANRPTGMETYGGLP